MTDFLQMAEQLAAHVIPKRTVRYVRGSYWVSELLVTVGSTLLAYDDHNGVRQRAEMRDYIFDPVDLVIGGVVVEPVEGDTIIDTGEGKTRTYMVMAGHAAEAWRYCDRYHKLIRVHVKEVEESAL